MPYEMMQWTEDIISMFNVFFSQARRLSEENELYEKHCHFYFLWVFFFEWNFSFFPYFSFLPNLGNSFYSFSFFLVHKIVKIMGKIGKKIVAAIDVKCPPTD
jgi:hypothetical protein